MEREYVCGHITLHIYQANGHIKKNERKPLLIEQKVRTKQFMHKNLYRSSLHIIDLDTLSISKQII